MRQTRRFVLGVVVALGLLAGLPATLALAAPVVAPAGPGLTVAVPALNFRDGPGTNYNVLAVLKQGEGATITGRDAARQWYQVQLPDGRSGWVYAALVQAGPDAAAVPVVAAPPVPAAGAGSPYAGQGAPAGHVIVFQTSSGGPIYAVNPDGSGLRMLTNGIDPALSPDGKTVAFTRWENSNNGAPGSLWLINVDGSGERQLLGTNINQPKSPTWSPDGQKIAISVQQGGNIFPERKCQPWHPGLPLQPPSGSVDVTVGGGKLCFTMPADPHWALGEVTVGTGAFQSLPSDIHSWGPSWDPSNANRIVFQGNRGLYNADIGGNTFSQLTGDTAQVAPVFSPDGRKIAVSYQQDGYWTVHVLNADGSGETRLTDTSAPSNSAAPAWSPDGSRIAFVTDRSGAWEIWVMNADGSNQHPLLAPQVQDGLNIQYHGVDERVVSWR
jgi:TolB protein